MGNFEIIKNLQNAEVKQCRRASGCLSAGRCIIFRFTRWEGFCTFTTTFQPCFSPRCCLESFWTTCFKRWGKIRGISFTGGF